MRALIVAMVLTVTPAHASPPRLPEGVTCDLVRAKVAEHGKVIAYAWARLQGFRKWQIEQAKRCLRE